MGVFHRSVGKGVLLVGALMMGVGITYLTYSQNSSVPGGLVIITLLPFVMAAMLGIAKNTTV